MSTIGIAAIIIAVTVVPPYIFMRLHERAAKKRLAQLLTRFTAMGTHYGLHFTRQEILKDKILGLDIEKQTLLVFPVNQEGEPSIVDLKNIETCTVYKDYHQVAVSDSAEAKKEQVLTQIGIKLVFSNDSPSLPVAFYSNHADVIYEIQELEKKARQWEQLLSPAITMKAQRA